MMNHLGALAVSQAHCGQFRPRLPGLPLGGSGPVAPGPAQGWIYVAPSLVPQNVAAAAWYMDQQPSQGGGNLGQTQIMGSDGRRYMIGWTGVANNRYFVTVVYVWGVLPMGGGAGPTGTASA